MTKNNYIPICPHCKQPGKALFFPYAAVLYECENKHGWYYSAGRETILTNPMLFDIKNFLKIK